jgi:Tfp pilus assembly protein PilF
VAAPPEEQRALLESLATQAGDGVETLWSRARALRRLGREASAEFDALEEGAPPELRVRARLLRIPLDRCRLRYERALRPLLAPVEGAGNWARLLEALRLSVYERPVAALEAAEALEGALGQEPSYWAHLATLRPPAGRRRALARALELDPSDPRLHLTVARLHLDSAEVALAIASTERAASLTPQAAEVLRVRALLGIEELTTPLETALTIVRSPREYERMLARSSYLPIRRSALRRGITQAFPDYAQGWSALATHTFQRERHLSPALAYLAEGWQRIELPQSRARVSVHLLKLVEDGAQPPAVPKDSSIERLLTFSRLRLKAPWESVRERWQRSVTQHPGELLLACELLKERAWREPLDAVLEAAAGFEARCREARAAVELASWCERLATLPEAGAQDAAFERIRTALELDPSAPEPWLARSLLSQVRGKPELALEQLMAATLRGDSWQARLRHGALAMRFSKTLSLSILGRAILGAPLDPQGLFTLIVGLESDDFAPQFKAIGGPAVRVDLNLALLHTARGQGREAMAILQNTRGMELLPADLLLRAQLALGLGQREVARQDLEQLEKRWPRRGSVQALRTRLGN